MRMCFRLACRILNHVCYAGEAAVSDVNTAFAANFPHGNLFLLTRHSTTCISVCNMLLSKLSLYHLNLTKMSFIVLDIAYIYKIN